MSPIWLTLARRELRGGLKGFRIFLACLMLGVAAIAGVGSVADSLLAGLRADARNILGGDIDIESVHRPITDDALAYLRGQGSVSLVTDMRSMARNPNGDQRTLAELKSVDGAYPLVGSLALEPDMPVAAALENRGGVWGAAIDANLLDRLDVALGDRIRIGELDVEVRATIALEPDRAVSFASFGPRVMIANAALPETGLVQPGTLIEYNYRLTLPSGVNRDAWMAEYRQLYANENGWRVRGVDQAAPGLRRFIDRIAQFLTLVGLTALLVGGVGVGNAVKSYLEGKTATIATLKCLGAEGQTVFRAYLALVMILAAGGILAGLVVGALLPFAAAAVLNQLLPVKVVAALYWGPLGLATLFGLLTALAFSLWPLARAMEIKPAALFRQLTAADGGAPRLPYLLALGVSGIALAALAIFSSSDRLLAGWFVAGSLGAVIVFLGAAWLLMKGVGAVGRPKRPTLRLALANLHRPGAPTSSIALSLGLGLTVLIAVALTQQNMSRQVTENLPEQAPSYFFIDIQPNQVSQFQQIVDDVPGVSNVERTPMVRGRIARINGVPGDQVAVDPEVRWALRGDRGLTYAAEPMPGAQIVAGDWWPADYQGPPLISLDAEIAAGFGVGIGDQLTVNVLGREITATIHNLRRIDWGTLSINFVIVFAPGTLEAAPHSIIATVNTDGPVAEEAVQRAVTDALPNVNAIRVKDALEAANRILQAVGSAVRITASVAILAGTLVLGGAVVAGHHRRVYDAVVLKVLGATRRNVIGAFLLEYGLLGIMIAAIAAVVGTIASWAVLTFVMKSDFVFAPGAVIWTSLLCTLITVVFGLFGTWRALGQKAAPLLRNE
ncbi:ABC transporter permease [Oceanibaculum pacificum]|uniref:Glycosyl transferase family 1 n=1 Tax=Oceanibaculum pacificum TaxID=580166 RepID=A0A154VQM3_9PROT|nr:FtsX-like permease family protein [Oceanibaculum pacificum]KZD03528.1 glycosyl transferase family 1 [Oceanibaculum pacificum]